MATTPSSVGVSAPLADDDSLPQVIPETSSSEALSSPGVDHPVVLSSPLPPSGVISPPPPILPKVPVVSMGPVSLSLFSLRGTGSPVFPEVNAGDCETCLSWNEKVRF